jgi:hypothetical protein
MKSAARWACAAAMMIILRSSCSFFSQPAIYRQYFLKIHVLRLGDHHSIRIPKTEIERLLSENLVPALGE